MALTYGFYDAVNHDRQYNALQISSIFDGIITDGVYEGIGAKFAVSPVSGMQIKVGTGRAWFNHTWTYNDADMPLTLDAASPTDTRIDAVVLEVNNTEAVRTNSIKIIKGSNNGLRPTLTNANGIYQHAIAYITVSAETTSITAANIQNVVGTSQTPVVTSVLQQTNVTALYSQWESQFQQWFANVQSQLEGDVAANLELAIETNYANTLRNETKANFGLPNDAIPDNVFSFLSNFNKYWWRETNGTQASSYVEERNVAPWLDYKWSGSLYPCTGITINQTTGEISAVGKDETSGHYYRGRASSSAELSTVMSYLKGHYVVQEYTETSTSGITVTKTFFYIPSNATIGSTFTTSYDDEVGEWHLIYPVNPSIPMEKITSKFELVPAGTVSYVFSSDPTAYPVDGTSGGKTYMYLGKPYEGFSEQPTKVLSDYYVGTGTVNPSLTFNFVPKLLIVAQSPYSLKWNSSAGVESCFIWIRGTTTIYQTWSSRSQPITFTHNGKTLSWSSSSASVSCNEEAQRYNYLVIG